MSTKMLTHLQEHCDVKVLDRSSRNFLALLCEFLKCRIGGVGTSMYIGLSGGVGQYLDCLFLLVARMSALRIVVHHHSFAYIDRPTLISRLLFRLVRNSSHVVLCDQMKDRLLRKYELDPGLIHVLSNSVLVDDEESSSTRTAPESLTIGFLSNITEEKGIFDYFNVIRAAKAQGLKISGLVAGPVDAGIEARFGAELQSLPEVRHIGPVYGEDKSRFYRSIDLLLFPTRYRNEAEPVTIIEALRAGVPVVAAMRGCIYTLVGASGVVVPLEDFAEASIEEIKQMGGDVTHYQERRILARRQYDELAASNSVRLREIIGAIRG